MKKQWLIYFMVALFAELGTTLMQSRFAVVTDLEPGVIYYPRFSDFVIIRLVIWLVLYLAITAAINLTARLLRMRTASR